MSARRAKAGLSPPRGVDADGDRVGVRGIDDPSSWITTSSVVTVAANASSSVTVTAIVWVSAPSTVTVTVTVPISSLYWIVWVATSSDTTGATSFTVT